VTSPLSRLPVAADLDESGAVDLGDLKLIADYWLIEQFWP